MRWWPFVLVVGLLAAAVTADSSPSGEMKRKTGRRIYKNGTMRRVRSRLAKSCGGEVGSVLLEQWYRHCQLVFTAAVDGIDRERGWMNVTLRRVIRTSVTSANASVNSLDQMDDDVQPGSPMTLEGLFDARVNSCVPQFRIRVHDVLLFLVRKTTTDSPDQVTRWRLVSAPLRITLRNLRLIHTSPIGKLRNHSLLLFPCLEPDSIDDPNDGRWIAINTSILTSFRLASRSTVGINRSARFSHANKYPLERERRRRETKRVRNYSSRLFFNHRWPD